jgi:BclA C-terminal domain
MKKLSFRPSPAMVVACVALFVALGGTATAVTYVVSSNSQVGPGTISGHNPPSGKHANIIGGSVNSADLANGAATLGKLAPNSVNGSKVVDGSLSAADTNTASIQQRVTGTCPSGQAAQSVNQDGDLNCLAINAAPGYLDAYSSDDQVTGPANLTFDTTAQASGITVGGANTTFAADTAGEYLVTVTMVNENSALLQLQVNGTGVGPVLWDHGTRNWSFSRILSLGAGDAITLNNSAGVTAAYGADSSIAIVRIA